jgi:hypothetical protein
MTDEEIKQSYYQYQSPTTNDASREFYLKAIKARAKVKGYKVTGFTKMPVSQLREIYNKSNNLSV